MTKQEAIKKFENIDDNEIEEYLSHISPRKPGYSYPAFSEEQSYWEKCYIKLLKNYKNQYFLGVCAKGVYEGWNGLNIYRYVDFNFDKIDPPGRYMDIIKTRGIDNVSC